MHPTRCKQALSARVQSPVRAARLTTVRTHIIFSREPHHDVLTRGNETAYNILMEGVQDFIDNPGHRWVYLQELSQVCGCVCLWRACVGWFAQFGWTLINLPCTIFPFGTKHPLHPQLALVLRGWDRPANGTVFCDGIPFPRYYWDRNWKKGK